jgi:hypothetical protein
MAKRVWSDMMSKKLLSGMLLVASISAASSQPHLFIGGMLGSSLTSLKPVPFSPQISSRQASTLAQILQSPATGDTVDNVLYETSETVQQNFVFTPSVGMTFPIADFFILEGAASLDLRKSEYTVSNGLLQNQILASIDRQIGVSVSAQMRISKQYAIGPVFVANILRNKSDMYGSSALEKEHNVYSYGFQSTYDVNNNFSLAIHCTSTLDQQIKLESPTDSAQNLELDYLNAQLTISARFMPI